MRLVGDPLSTGRITSAGGMVWQAAFICDGCGSMSVGFVSSRASSAEIRSAFEGPGVTWIPESQGVGKEYPAVPPDIASCASEAVQCSSIGANRAAVLLARTTIEATAKHYGITKGTLADKIDGMAEQGLVLQRLAEAAHQVRLLGNDQAHGDLSEPVTAEDADAVLRIMDALFLATFDQDATISYLQQRNGH